MTLFMNTLALINFDLIKRTEDVVGVVVWARIRSLFQGASSTRLRLLLLSVLLLLLLLLLLVNLLTSRWRVAPFAVWRRSWQPEAAEWKKQQAEHSSASKEQLSPSSSAAASFSLLWHSSSGKSFLPIYVALTSQHRRRCAHHQHIPLSSSCAQL